MMIKNTLITFLVICLVLALSCKQDLSTLTKEAIPKLFPQALTLTGELAESPVQIRKNRNGQWLIDDQKREIRQMLILTQSEEGDAERVAYMIIEPDLDTAIGVVPGLSTGTLDDLGPNMLIPSILKLNDTSFLATDIVIKSPIANLLDSTTVITGPASLNDTTRSVSIYNVIRDAENQYTHLKTQLRYQQDSVAWFLKKFVK